MVSRILKDLETSDIVFLWTNKLEYKKLVVGTFNIEFIPTAIYETNLLHKANKILIITIFLARIPKYILPINERDHLYTKEILDQIYSHVHQQEDMVLHH